MLFIIIIIIVNLVFDLLKEFCIKHFHYNLININNNTIVLLQYDSIVINVLLSVWPLLTSHYHRPLPQATHYHRPLQPVTATGHSLPQATTTGHYHRPLTVHRPMATTHSTHCGFDYLQ